MDHRRSKRADEPPDPGPAPATDAATEWSGENAGVRGTNLLREEAEDNKLARSEVRLEERYENDIVNFTTKVADENTAL